MYQNSLTDKLYIYGFDPLSLLQPQLFHRIVAPSSGHLVVCTQLVTVNSVGTNSTDLSGLEWHTCFPDDLVSFIFVKHSHVQIGFKNASLNFKACFVYPN